MRPPEPSLAAAYDRMDRLPVTRLHWYILIVCALGLLFDVVEAGLSNALSAVFSAAPYKVAPTELSLLLGSVFIGGAVGAPLLGWFADRRGRQTAVGVSLLALTLTSLLAAVSTSIEWLTVCRLLSGVALGSYPALMAAYLTDVLPPRRRGTMILLSAAIGFLGAPAVIFLVAALTPSHPLGFDGWRWALVIGAIGSAGVGWLVLYLPESPRWLWAVGRTAAADAACARFERSAGGAAPARADVSIALAPHTTVRLWSGAGGSLRKRALVFALLDFLSPWATIGFPLMSGAVFIAKGFRVGDSLLYVGVTMFGPTLGVLLFAALVDRVERRLALAAAAATMMVCGAAFALGNAPAQLMAAGVVFQMLGAIYVTTLNVYAAEAFPTELRAAVSSSTWAVNRIAAACAPLVLLPLLKGAGVLAMFALIGGVLLASAALVLALGPRGLTREAVG